MASNHEAFWLEVIRQASADRDPAPNLNLVRRVREIFREPEPGQEETSP